MVRLFVLVLYGVVVYRFIKTMKLLLSINFL